MNSHQRIALQKKKRKLAQARNFQTAIDVAELRSATLAKFTEILRVPLDNDAMPLNSPAELANVIENELFEQHKTDISAYKATFRRLFISLKLKNSSFRKELLMDTISPKQFAHMSPYQLKTAEQKISDKKSVELSMQQSVGQQLLPENVNYVKDGRDREKWGVSKSAAALDD